MNRCLQPALLVLSFPSLAFVVIATNVSAGPLTYDVGTINLHSPVTMEDYVVTGTITTNGTIGPLGPSDIVSWSISVNGPRPFTFHPANRGAMIDATDVRASLTTLEMFRGHFAALSFSANEDTLPNCSSCQQLLSWSGFARDVSYAYYDTADDDPSLTFTFADLSFYGDPIIIAARVREPLGLSMAFLGTAIFGRPPRK